MPVEKFLQEIDDPAVITSITKNWINNENVSDIFEKYSIDKNFFISHFGLKILDYFIRVFSGKEEIGNCPYIERFLEFLDEKQLFTGDVFLICSGLKLCILEFVLENKSLTEEEKKQLLKDIYNIFDKNLSIVLNRFVEKHF